MNEPCFNRHHAKYRCCWGIVHVEAVTKIICMIAILEYIALFDNYASNKFGNLWGNLELARIIIGSLMVTGTLTGIQQTKPYYFVPYMCYLSFMIFYNVVQIPLWLFAYFPQTTLGYDLRVLIRTSFSDMKSESATDDIVTYIIVSSALTLFFEICLLWVICKCYKFLFDKSASGCNETSLPQLCITSGH